MEQKQLEFFKNLLLERMSQILGTAEKTVTQMSQDDDTFPDPVDRALTESSRSVELRTRDRERKLLPKIANAIQRIEDGSYGICEECGGDISENRLKVRPEAALCIKCKEEQEKVERQFGG
ncbi:MAG: RNA polymerase-binding protein DksA [Deltaproteobacteria bacterium]